MIFRLSSYKKRHKIIVGDNFMRILLVEDDINLGQGIKTLLEIDGYEIELAENGAEAIDEFKYGIAQYDVVLLDWMLPELSGLEVCKWLRDIKKGHYTGGIIFLTAKSELDDCVQALEVGADDYITKPFEIRELKARIHAVLRRKNKPYVDSSFEAGGFVMERYGLFVGIKVAFGPVGNVLHNRIERAGKRAYYKQREYEAALRLPEIPEHHCRVAERHAVHYPCRKALWQQVWLCRHKEHTEQQVARGQLIEHRHKPRVLRARVKKRQQRAHTKARQRRRRAAAAPYKQAYAAHKYY